MPIASYGDRGHPLLIFPVGQGDCLEVERIRLIQAIEPHLFAGRCHAFSAESINRHAWMNPEVPPPEAARRQALYAAYVEDEVVPYIRRVTGAPDARIAVAGAGFGAGASQADTRANASRPASGRRSGFMGPPGSSSRPSRRSR